MSLDFDAARARFDAFTASHSHSDAFACCTAHASADDVPALLAEIERLQAAIQRFRNEWTTQGDSTWHWLTRILHDEEIR